LVIVDLVCVSADALQVVNHIDRQLKLRFDDLDQDIFGYVAFFVGLATQRHESIQVFVYVTLYVVVQLLVFVPFYG